MKAFHLCEGSLGQIAAVDVNTPVQESGFVILKMKAWSLNYRDLLVAKGKYSNRLPSPLVPLSDGVGEIIALPENCQHLKIGQRVACLFFPDWQNGRLEGEKTRRSLGANEQGVLSELVAIKEAAIIPVPDFLTDEEAACLPCAGLTAWNALFHSQEQFSGKSLLIMGSGGVSLFALQFAKAAGWKVAAVSRRKESLEKMKNYGLDYGVVTEGNPTWGDAIRSWTEGGVDQVVELGGGSTLPQSIRAVRTGGEISLIGILGGAEKEFNPLPIIMKGILLRGIFVGSKEMFHEMNKAIESHNIHPVIDCVFPFEQAMNALEYLGKGNHFGKVCLSV